MLFMFIFASLPLKARLRRKRKVTRMAMIAGDESGMKPDEFNRKYHPFPALLNLMSKTPKVDEVASAHSQT